MLSLMPSFVPSIANVPTITDDPSPKCINPNTNPATLPRMESMTYNQNKNGYNLEWESRANFNNWLTHEQAMREIEIWLSMTQASKT